MSSLVMLEDGLVNIYEYQENKERIVNARELHSFLGVGKDFTTWMKDRIKKYGFEEGFDYFLTLTKIGERKNVTKHEYYLKIDTAKELAMVENNEKGRMVRKYFIEVEKKFREQNQMQPMSIEDLIIQQAQLHKQMRIEMEQIKSQTKETKNNVIEMKKYLMESPDSKTIEHKVNEYARKNRMTQAEVRNMVYKKIGDKYGIDVYQRVKNKHSKINEERVSQGKKPYAESTLKNKYNGMDVIHEEKLHRQFLEILAGMA